MIKSTGILLAIACLVACPIARTALGDLQPASASITQRPPFTLHIGEQRLIHVPGLARFSLGSNSARSTRLPEAGFLAPDSRHRSSDYLLIKGVSPGYADLWTWSSDGRMTTRTIRVDAARRSGPEGARSAMEEALEALSEVEIYRSGKLALLRGWVLSEDEAARVASLSLAFGAEIIDATRLSPDLLSRGLTTLEAWARANEPGLRVEAHSDRIWIRGSGFDARSRAQTETRIRALFPLVDFELSALPDSAPTVLFRVYLVEVRHEASRAIGLSWPESQPGALTVQPWRAELGLSLSASLRALEEKGALKLLSNPELAVRAPGEAELFSGGEFPVRMRTSRENYVIWKKYGLLLKLRIKETDGDRVRLEIETEVSELDSRVTVDETPGVHANRMSTQVDARFGSPLHLSGLVKQGLRESESGLPWISRIPILGLLFGTRGTAHDHVEVAAVLVPERAPPPPPLRAMGRLAAAFPDERELLQSEGRDPWPIDASASETPNASPPARPPASLLPRPLPRTLSNRFGR